jgi:hypothetical protein
LNLGEDGEEPGELREIELPNDSDLPDVKQFPFTSNEGMHN